MCVFMHTLLYTFLACMLDMMYACSGPTCNWMNRSGVVMYAYDIGMLIDARGYCSTCLEVEAEGSILEQGRI